MSKEIKNRELFNLPFELVRWKNKKAEIQNQEVVVSKELTFLKNLRGEETKILKPIQNEIKSGKDTTGDEIKDFVIVRHPKNEEIENQYRRLADNLKEHYGELILIKKIKKEELPSMGFPKRPAWFENCQLGIINQKTPEFNFKSGKIFFTDGFLSFETDYLTYKVQPRRAMNFKYSPNKKSYLFYFDYKYLNQPIEKFEPMARGIKDFQLEIFIGNNAVREKLQNYSNLNGKARLPQNIADRLRSPKT